MGLISIMKTRLVICYKSHIPSIDWYKVADPKMLTHENKLENKLKIK